MDSGRGFCGLQDDVYDQSVIIKLQIVKTRRMTTTKENDYDEEEKDVEDEDIDDDRVWKGSHGGVGMGQTPPSPCTRPGKL